MKAVDLQACLTTWDGVYKHSRKVTDSQRPLQQSMMLQNLWYKPKNKSTKYVCRDRFKIINKRGQGRRISFKIKPKLNKDKTPGYPKGPELPCFWSPIKLCVFPAQKEPVSIVKLIIYLLHCLITLHVSSFDLWNQQQKNLSIRFLWGTAFLISTFFLMRFFSLSRHMYYKGTDNKPVLSRLNQVNIKLQRNWLFL